MVSQQVLDAARAEIARAPLQVSYQLLDQDGASSGIAGITDGQVQELRATAAGCALAASSVSAWATGFVAQLAGTEETCDDAEVLAQLPTVISGRIQVLMCALEAVTEQREDLARAALEHDPLQIRVGDSWRVVSTDEAIALVHQLQGSVRGRLLLQVRAVGQEHVTLGWTRYPGGWRECASGAPGRMHLIKRSPQVLADRLIAALAPRVGNVEGVVSSRGQ